MLWIRIGKTVLCLLVLWILFYFHQRGEYLQTLPRYKNSGRIMTWTSRILLVCYIVGLLLVRNL